MIDAAIDKAGKLYSKGTWGCVFRSDDGISDTDDIGDLWIDYICEFGPRDRVFGPEAHLTKELAQTVLVARLRTQFYAEGGASLTSENSSQMDAGAFMDAKFGDFRRTGQPITITDFLGGLDSWSVTRQKSSAGKDVVRFEIYNETTLASGTRIGFTRPGTRQISKIDYRSHPALYNRDGSAVVDAYRIDRTQFNMITILNEKEERNPADTWGRGGGTMTQRFIWEEPYDTCYTPRLTPPIWLIQKRVVPNPM